MAAPIHSVRHFLSVLDLSASELRTVISAAFHLKRQPRAEQLGLLPGKTMGMVFEKPSLRTHVSFQTGMNQMGGHGIYLGPQNIGLGKREPISDVAGVLSGMVDILTARVFENKTVQELAKHSSIPVINALCDVEHPCQAVADMLTILECKGKLDNSIKLTFVGDGNNNVTHSLALAGAQLGLQVAVAAPPKHFMRGDISEQARKIAKTTGGQITETDDVDEAVADSDIVYTDTFVSMGQEEDAEARLKDFDGYNVTDTVMKLAKPDAIFMHDMPAYRGVEVDVDVIDGRQSVIFQQAHNRLHAQKAIVLFLMNALPELPEQQQ